MPKVYLARQPILNRSGKIFGYELFFRDDNGVMEHFPSNLTATSRVLMNTLNHMDFHHIKGHDERKLFINIDHTILQAGILELLDPEHFILEILETTEVEEAVLEKVANLSTKGFAFALDDFDCSAEMLRRFSSLLPLMDYIKIDIMHADPKRVKLMVPKLKEYGLVLLAEKVETKEQYLEFSQLGCDLFQGYYFHLPEKLEASLYNHTEPHEIYHQIQLIQKGNEKEIVAFFKRKPDVSYNLIRFLNSKHGTMEEVTSIENALKSMGKERLLRWLLAYLYSEHQSKRLNETLLDRALTRALNMEMIFEEEREKAYLTGLYSMIDDFFEEDKRIVLDRVILDMSIKEAIIEHKGPMGAALQRIYQEENERTLSCETATSSMRSIVEGLKKSGN